MTRISSGDVSCVERLCQQLSDRLVYIPAVGVRSMGRMVNVAVMRLSGNDRPIVPVFTSEKRLKAWVVGRPEVVETISVFGADLFAVIRPEIGVVLDPGIEFSVTLDPQTVIKSGQACCEDENFYGGTVVASASQRSSAKEFSSDVPPTDPRAFSVVGGNPRVGPPSVDTFDPHSEEYAYARALSVNAAVSPSPPTSEPKRSFFALFGGKK